MSMKFWLMELVQVEETAVVAVIIIVIVTTTSGWQYYVAITYTGFFLNLSWRIAVLRPSSCGIQHL